MDMTSPAANLLRKAQMFLRCKYLVIGVFAFVSLHWLIILNHSYSEKRSFLPVSAINGNLPLSRDQFKKSRKTVQIYNFEQEPVLSIEVEDKTGRLREENEKRIQNHTNVKIQQQAADEETDLKNYELNDTSVQTHTHLQDDVMKESNNLHTHMVDTNLQNLKSYNEKNLRKLEKGTFQDKTSIMVQRKKVIQFWNDLLKESMMRNKLQKPRSFPKHVCNSCLDVTNHNLVIANKLCKIIKHLKLVVIIHSGINDRDIASRQIVRNTWLNFCNHQRSFAVCVFVVGHRVDDPQNQSSQQLLSESKKYGDLIIGNFVDSYTNLTLKTLTGLRWASENCGKAKYVLKTDADVFINIPLLLDTLSIHPAAQHEDSYGGWLWEANTSAVFRDARSRLFVPYNVYPEHYYPPYCSGHAYVLSLNLVPRILNKLKDMWLLPVEDAFIGIVLRSLNVPPYEIPYLFPFPPEWLVKCQCIISWHRPPDMTQLYKHIVTCGAEAMTLVNCRRHFKRKWTLPKDINKTLPQPGIQYKNNMKTEIKQKPLLPA